MFDWYLLLSNCDVCMHVLCRWSDTRQILPGILWCGVRVWFWEGRAKCGVWFLCEREHKSGCDHGSGRGSKEWVMTTGKQKVRCYLRGSKKCEAWFRRWEAREGNNLKVPQLHATMATCRCVPRTVCAGNARGVMTVLNNHLPTTGPRPHLRGYTSLLITTRLILAQKPWSHVTISAVHIMAIAADNM